MPKTKKSVKSTSKKVTTSKRTSMKEPHMTKTIFGASYLLVLAVLSLLLITVSNQLTR